MIEHLHLHTASPDAVHFRCGKKPVIDRVVLSIDRDRWNALGRPVDLTVTIEAGAANERP